MVLLICLGNAVSWWLLLHNCKNIIPTAKGGRGVCLHFAFHFFPKLQSSGSVWWCVLPATELMSDFLWGDYHSSMFSVVGSLLSTSLSIDASQNLHVVDLSLLHRNVFLPIVDVLCLLMTGIEIPKSKFHESKVFTHPAAPPSSPCLSSISHNQSPPHPHQKTISMHCRNFFSCLWPTIES